MTVLVDLSTRSYVGNGVTTVYATGFKFLSNSHLTVKKAGVTLTEGVDYTVTGAGDDAGGNVTMVVAPAAAAAVVITRNTPLLQEVDLRPEGRYEADTLEGMDDRAMLILQDLKRRIAALEALGVTLTSSVSASIIYADVTFLTNANSVEASFPMNAAVVGGSTATGAWAVRLRNLDDGSDVFDEPPALQWAPGVGNNVSIMRVSGLKPSTNYTLRIAAVIP